MQTVDTSGNADKRGRDRSSLGGWPRVAAFIMVAIVAVVTIMVTRDPGTVAEVVTPLMLPLALVIGSTGGPGRPS